MRRKTIINNFKNDQYYIRFNFPKDGMIYQDYFSSIENVLNGFYNFEKEILKAFNSKIELEIYIEDIKQGSLKIYLKNKLKNLSDEDIDNFVDQPIKTSIKFFLKKSRNKLISALEKEDKKIIEGELITDLNEEIENFTKNNNFPNEKYLLFKNFKLIKNNIIKSCELIASGSYKLENKIFYNDTSDDIKNEKQVKGMKIYDNTSIIIIDDECDDFLKSININTCIYKLISPIFKEDCKWKFSDGDNKDFYCSVSDGEFLNKVKNREISIKDGDMYRVQVEIKTFVKKNKIENERNILKVMEIIEPNILL
jgi:hypothetical protein